MEDWCSLKLDEIKERIIELKKAGTLDETIISDLSLDHRHGTQLLVERLRKEMGIAAKEEKRLLNMRVYEEEAYSQGFQRVAGVDEAGRGPLAGPVVAAAVILPNDILIEGLNDSKKLSPAKRDSLFDTIKARSIAIGVGIIDPQVIDEINILQATYRAMQKAIEEIQPDFVIIDGNSLPKISLPARTLPKGDSLSLSIAAASIIAKVTRDRIMDELHGLYPQYGFDRHKGYGTLQHISAIRKYGLSPIHRRSFCRAFNQLSLAEA